MYVEAYILYVLAFVYLRGGGMDGTRLFSGAPVMVKGNSCKIERYRVMETE